MVVLSINNVTDDLLRWSDPKVWEQTRDETLLIQMMDRMKIQTLDEETLTFTEIMQKEILEKSKGDQI